MYSSSVPVPEDCWPAEVPRSPRSGFALPPAAAMASKSATLLALLPAAAALSSPGWQAQRAHKVSARANRLDTLLRRPARTVAERKEIDGLRRHETYDESAFSAAHARFKASHNARFVDLATHCGGVAAAALPRLAEDASATIKQHTQSVGGCHSRDNIS